jgi:two-component system, OmpR family, sensor histidine kinase SenX3
VVVIRRRRGSRADLPEGLSLSELLSALGGGTLLLSPSDAVLHASSDVIALGLVRGDEVTFEGLRALIANTRATGSAHEREFSLPWGEELRELHISAAPAGRSGHILVLVEDAGEQQRIDAVRRDFVANVSHELKTPLGGLSLLAEAISDASADSEAVRKFADRMQIEAKRLSQLVTDLISLSSLQSGDVITGREVVSLDDVVDTAMDRCRPLAQTSSILLVAGGDQGLTVLGNAEQLTTALRNLIANAIAYSPQQTQVGIAVRGIDGHVEITVTDQGIGIPEGDLERIFERFYRVDAARSRATGGTGLGLAIVKHVASNHGGSVSVWSVEDAGSTFTLQLPLAPDAVEHGEVL